MDTFLFTKKGQLIQQILISTKPTLTFGYKCATPAGIWQKSLIKLFFLVPKSLNAYKLSLVFLQTFRGMLPLSQWFEATFPIQF